MWFLTIHPFVGIPVFMAKLSKRQYCWRVFEDFHNQEHIQFFDIHNCLFMRLHFSIGGYDCRRLHDFVKVSISALLKSFLLIICIDTPESTTNSFSSGFKDDARWHLFSRRREECCSFMLFQFEHIFGQLPRCFAGT